MNYSLQFNDGMGWRVMNALTDVTPQEAVNQAKDHHLRFKNDHIRVVKDNVIIWSQDGANARERGLLTW